MTMIRKVEGWVAVCDECGAEYIDRDHGPLGDKDGVVEQAVSWGGWDMIGQKLLCWDCQLEALRRGK